MINVPCAAIFREGRVLVAKRPPDKEFAGLWEIPGGKAEADEDVPSTLWRESWEELALQVEPGNRICFVELDVPTVNVPCRVSFYRCYIHGSVEAQPLASTEIRWMTPKQLSMTHLTPATTLCLDSIIAALLLEFPDA